MSRRDAASPLHEHADLRFVLATRMPEAARPESPDAPLRWVTPDQAYEATAEPSLRETVARVQRLLTS